MCCPYLSEPWTTSPVSHLGHDLNHIISNSSSGGSLFKQPKTNLIQKNTRWGRLSASLKRVISGGGKGLALVGDPGESGGTLSLAVRAQITSHRRLKGHRYTLLRHRASGNEALLSDRLREEVLSHQTQYVGQNAIEGLDIGGQARVYLPLTGAKCGNLPLKTTELGGVGSDGYCEKE